MDTTLVFVFLIIALLAGLGVGWFLGARPIADWRARHDQRDADAKAAEGMVKAMTVDLAAMSEQVKALEARIAELANVRRERDELAPALAAAQERAADADRIRTELAALRANREELRAELERMKAEAEGFSAKERLLIEAQETLRKEFENAGHKVLEKAQEAFLARANARFAESEKTSEARLKAVLEPVGAKLEKYEAQVQALEAKRIDDFGGLRELIDGMRQGQEAVRTAALQLGNSLRNGPKTRGRWGELQLRNVLEQCGLAERTDFVTEHSVETDDGRLRPDAIVRIPGNKILVIDAKVSLNDHQDSVTATDDATRDAFLDRHVQSMKNHINTLGSKAYQDQFPDSPDFVVMFVPGDHFISSAIDHDLRRRSMSIDQGALLRDADLWNYAFERRVLLTGPTNLVAIARTIAQVWRQDGLAREAREIGKMGGELYDRLAKVAEDLSKVGLNLGRAVTSYNDFARSFESRVLVTGKRLRDKHIEIGKREIEDVPLIETVPRHAESEGPKLALVEPDTDGEATE
ncbi:DNA recombination protein RmuC [Novosphingobium sp.]|uniref:DNA recombination protein RmuC n=1 Tax=Novosphingobium sp. TaxID=1874826 RepID=UPI0026034697|nr:DNA recombination protein RmuC [Novosphingobium sp.]